MTIIASLKKSEISLIEGKSFKVDLNLSSSLNIPIEVNYEILPISDNIKDITKYFNILKGKILFSVGQKNKSFSIKTIDDNIADDPKKFKIVFDSKADLDFALLEFDGTIYDNDIKINVQPNILLNQGLEYKISIDNQINQAIDLQYHLNDTTNQLSFINNQDGKLRFDANAKDTKVISILADDISSIASPLNFELSFKSINSKVNLISENNNTYLFTPEQKAPEIYLTSNTNQLDSITSLLMFDKKIQNNIDFSHYPIQQWKKDSSTINDENIIVITNKTSDNIFNKFNSNIVLTYSFYIQSLNKQDSPNAFEFTALQQKATRQALQDYANITNIVFQEVTNQKADIYFTNVPSIDDSYVGNTISYLKNDGSLVSGVVVQFMDSNQNSINSSFAKGSYNYTTLIHEIGHALGLKHTGFYENGGDGNPPYLTKNQDNNKYTIMSYNIHPESPSLNPQTPLIYDISAIQLLYGKNNNFHTEDNIYYWDKHSSPLLTLWDAGGTDTIDVSSQSKAQKIDLRMGQFSSIGNGKNNLSIAYDSLIENAIGGSGNDTIIGNQISNKLTGNAGADQFVFDSLLNENFNIDTITDFDISKDKIVLDKTIFSALSHSKNNTLLSTELIIGQEALMPTQHLIFNLLDHSLYYDSDGNGKIAPIKFLTFTDTISSLSNKNFLVLSFS